MRLGVFGVQFEHSTEAIDRLFRFALVLEGVAEIVMGRRVIGFQFEGVATERHRLGQFPARDKDITQVIVRLGIVRFQFDGAPQAIGGFVALRNYRRLLAPR